MVYGRARFTEDVDFVAVSGHQDMLAAKPEVMRDCGFDPSCTRKLYHQSGIDIDLWKDEHADGIVARSRSIELAGRAVRIAEPHDLIAMKLRAGRLRDDYDISEILLGREMIDDGIIRERVNAVEFERYSRIKERTQSDQR